MTVSSTRGKAPAIDIMISTFSWTVTTMDFLEQLEQMDLCLSPLPEVCASFRITKLAEKPQNPIMDSLRFLNLRSAGPLPEIHVESLETPEPAPHEIIPDLPDKSLWQAALECRQAVAVCVEVCTELACTKYWNSGYGQVMGRPGKQTCPNWVRIFIRTVKLYSRCSASHVRGSNRAGKLY